MSSLGSLFKYNISTKISAHQEFNINYELFIVPLPDKQNAVLLSDKTSLKVSLKKDTIDLISDDLLSPIIEKKFNKWDDTFNEYRKYETKFCIRGISLSPDGFTVAILYEIGRISLKYSIPSEQQYRLMILPLAENWEVSPFASGLAWYQTYNIYNTLPIQSELISNSLNVDTSLPVSYTHLDVYKRQGGSRPLNF